MVARRVNKEWSGANRRPRRADIRSCYANSLWPFRIFPGDYCRLFPPVAGITDWGAIAASIVGLFDESGSVVGTALAYQRSLAAGETWEFKTHGSVSAPKFRFDHLAGF